MPTDDLGQTPTSTTPEPDSEGQQPTAQPDQTQAPKLVDVNARDEQGHQLWFPREAIEQVRREAANYRTAG